MKKTLITITLLSCITLQAQSTKTTMTEEELIQKIMMMGKKIENQKAKTIKIESKTKAIKEKTRQLEKLEETVDKVAKKLGVNN